MTTETPAIEAQLLPQTAQLELGNHLSAGVDANVFHQVRFPMVFLCGLFFPVENLPTALQPLSYGLCLTMDGISRLHCLLVFRNGVSQRS